MNHSGPLAPPLIPLNCVTITSLFPVRDIRVARYVRSPQPMQIICFEDEFVDQLHPITRARPAYAITCASLRLVDLLHGVAGKLGISVRPYLRLIQKLDLGLEPPDSMDDADGILLVNARVVPRVTVPGILNKLAAENRSSVVIDEQDGSVLAAFLAAADLKSSAAEAAAAEDPFGSVDLTLIERARALPRSTHRLAAFRWPHDVISWHMSGMSEAMQWRISQGGYQQTSDGVFIGEGAAIGQYASIDTSSGPILLDKHVQVGPFCYLSGPVYAGPGTRVIEHAALKDGVALGHTVKIGGEVEASVIEPFTNKQHHGFLGHSYLGSWINLGAGTCNSDLKNTYGQINIEYGDKKVATGMQFLGCVMGDYSKSAINTSIFTGKVIGVCSMLYGFVTSNVPSFVNYARLFGQTAPLPADVMINTQQRMFARRQVAQRECDKQLIMDMYEQTAAERDTVEQYGL